MRLFALGLSALVWAFPVGAQETENGLLATLEPYEDGTWTLDEQGGWTVMTNATETSAVNYHSFTPDQEFADFSFLTAVFVEPKGDGPAFGGVMANFDPASGDYFAFAIDHHGTPVLMVRDDSGLNPIGQDNDQSARMDGSDIIGVRGGEGVMEMVLNDEVIFTMEIEGSFAPGFGILAVGQSRVGFYGTQLTVD